MPDPLDRDQAGAVVYAVHDAVIADADPECPGLADQCPRPWWPGIRAELVNACRNAALHVAAESAELPLSGRRDRDSVASRHGLKSKLTLHLLPGDIRLPCRFPDSALGGAGEGAIIGPVLGALRRPAPGRACGQIAWLRSHD